MRYVVLGFILFTIILTYPVAFNVKSLAGPPGDNLMFAWNMWWAMKALVELRVNLFQNSYTFYPNVVSLTYHAFSPFNSVTAIPLQYVFSLSVIYNLFLFFTFIFSALGAYLLVYYFTKDRLASFIAGLVFAFCPYHFAHAEAHLDLATMQFIPFSILYLVKLSDNPRFKNAIICSIFLTLNFYSCYYYGAFMVIFIAFYLIYLFFGNIFNWRILKEKMFNKRFIVSLMMTIFVSIILTLPLLYRFIKEGWKKSEVYAGGQEGYVSDLIGLFIPSLQHTLFRYFKWINAISSRFSGCPQEYTVFLGYTVIALALVSIFKARYRWKWFWGLSSLFFIIISFGPHLHILGKTYLKNIYLPYFWLVQNTPFIKNARCPSRLIVMAMLSLSVLAGYGFKHIFDNLNSRKKRLMFFMGICLLISFEYLTIPLIQTSVKIPKFYYELGKDKQDYAVLEFPIFMCDTYSNLYMYLQTIHGKRILNGFFSRQPSCVVRVLNEVAKLSNRVLTKYNIRYLIIHKGLISGPRNICAGQLLKGDIQGYIYDLIESEQKFKKLPVEDSDITVYQVPAELENGTADTELVYMFSKSGGEFNIEDEGVYLVKTKISVKPYLKRTKEDGLILEFKDEKDLGKWSFSPFNTICDSFINEDGGLYITEYFDGDSREDEYMQMKLEGININLRKYPYFYLVYKVEDSQIQTIEVVAGIDTNGDGRVDKYIKGLYPMPASSIVSRYVINFFDKIKEKIYSGIDPYVINIELYPHKMWGKDCSFVENKGIYRFWINKIGFYGYTLLKGREIINSVVDITGTKEWEVKYYPSVYRLKNKRNSIAVSQNCPYIEISRIVNDIDLRIYNNLELKFEIDDSSGLKSIEPILELNTSEDNQNNVEVSLGELCVTEGTSCNKIDIREKIVDNYPKLDKYFLNRVRIRLIIDENIEYNDCSFYLRSIRLYSEVFKPAKGFIFKEPIFELNGRIYWAKKEFGVLENAGNVALDPLKDIPPWRSWNEYFTNQFGTALKEKSSKDRIMQDSNIERGFSILFTRKVFLKTGKYYIKNLLGDDVDYIVLERVRACAATSVESTSDRTGET